MTDDAPLSYVSRAPKASGSGSTPAVVLVHGRGADEKDLLPISAQLSDELHVLSVRAPIEMDDGYAWYHLDVRQGGLHNSQPQSKSFRQSVIKLAQFVGYAAKKHNLDRSRIGLLGFSQGGTLSIATAIETPDRIAWVAALHGFLPEDYREASQLVEARSVPMFLTAGKMDLVVPDDRTIRARDRMRDTGIDVTYEDYNVGHGATDEEIGDVTAWVNAQL